MFHAAASYYAVDAGDYATARTEAESALDLARRTENPSAIASALLNVARSIEHDDPVRALDAFEQVLALGRAGAMQMILGLASVGVARLRSEKQERVAALEALYDAIGYAYYVGARPPVVEVIGVGVGILARVGEISTATVLAASLTQDALLAINASAHRDADLEQTFRTARASLGDEQCQRLVARGEAMSYEEVVEFALDHVRRAMSE
jgi:hypothetical protein